MPTNVCSDDNENLRKSNTYKTNRQRGSGGNESECELVCVTVETSGNVHTLLLEKHETGIVNRSVNIDFSFCD